MIIDKYRHYWASSSERTKLAAKNIVASFILKIASILTSLMIIPLTINYIDSTQYGIWLAVSSIVSWANFFDLGLANGFRNRFAEAKAKNNIILARQYLSTTYAFIAILMTGVFSCIWVINGHINLASVLNVDETYRDSLHQVFNILAFFFCMNMIANIFIKMLEADQRPAIASAISCIGQLFSLLVIFILTKTTEGNLINLATYFSGIPFFTMGIGSILIFSFTKYKKYRPSFSFVKISLIKDLLGLGISFFVIYLCLIAIFQLMNIVLSRVCGAEAVAEYNICYKYFSIVYMAFVIIVSPMWSAFTDAYTQKDFIWMKNIVCKFERMLFYVLLFCVLMLAVSALAYKIWLGDKIHIGFVLSIFTCGYTFTQVVGALYMHLINGIGTVRLQFIIYLLFAIVSYPLMILCCREFGTYGIVIVPSLVYICQAIIGRKQVRKILNQTATGIWLK